MFMLNNTQVHLYIIYSIIIILCAFASSFFFFLLFYDIKKGKHVQYNIHIYTIYIYIHGCFCMKILSSFFSSHSCRCAGIHSSSPGSDCWSWQMCIAIFLLLCGRSWLKWECTRRRRRRCQTIAECIIYSRTSVIVKCVHGASTLIWAYRIAIRHSLFGFDLVLDGWPKYTYIFCWDE